MTFKELIKETIDKKGIAVVSTINDYGIYRKLLDVSITESLPLLIIDRPDANLHPIWQTKYAEQIVKLVKENPVPIIIISHSPYFVEAIEIYSSDAGLDDKFDFYIANSKSVSMVTHDLSLIFKDFAKPFNELEELDAKGAI